MTEPDTELLDTLTAWMLEGGFTSLTYAVGDRSVTIRLAEAGSAAPAPRPVRVVASPALGRFLTRHPSAAEPLARPGARVKAGEIIALLDAGNVLIPVEAPCDGIMGRALAAEGAVAGYDDPLIEIEPLET